MATVNGRNAALSGLARLSWGAAKVTALSPRLPGGCQRAVRKAASNGFGRCKKADRQARLPERARKRYQLAELNSSIADNQFRYPNSHGSHVDRMTVFSHENIRTVLRGIGVRQVRLVCGMVLFGYLVSHFLNHALGNISMEALAVGFYYHPVFCHSLPVELAFYTAMLLPGALGLWVLNRRHKFSGKTGG